LLLAIIRSSVSRNLGNELATQTMALFYVLGPYLEESEYKKGVKGTNSILEVLILFFWISFLSLIDSSCRTDGADTRQTKPKFPDTFERNILVAVPGSHR